jgi:Ankyrin repeats (3 copies)/Ankyrin repeat
MPLIEKDNIVFACRQGFLYRVKTIIKRLIKCKNFNQPILIDINENRFSAGQWTALHYCADNATEFGPIMLREILSLREHGFFVDVDKSSLEGLTPLMLAVDSLSRKSVELLLNAGARVDICDNRGYYPLHFACLRGNFDIIRLIFEAKPDVINFKSNFLYTPFHFACRLENERVIDFLLSSKVPDLTIQTLMERETCHHLAAKSGHLPTVLRLIAANVESFEIRNLSLEKPHETAKRYSHERLGAMSLKFSLTLRRFPVLLACELAETRRGDVLEDQAVQGESLKELRNAMEILMSIPIDLQRITIKFV